MLARWGWKWPDLSLVSPGRPVCSLQPRASQAMSVTTPAGRASWLYAMAAFHAHELSALLRDPRSAVSMSLLLFVKLLFRSRRTSHDSDEAIPHFCHHHVFLERFWWETYTRGSK